MRVSVTNVAVVVSVAVRAAAAVFLLCFMIGDLAFPQYFCEEYVVYSSTAAGVAQGASGTSASVARERQAGASASAGTLSSRASAQDLSSEDFCLHIVHRPVFLLASGDDRGQQHAAPGRFLPVLPSLKGLYHPPRTA